MMLETINYENEFKTLRAEILKMSLGQESSLRIDTIYYRVGESIKKNPASTEEALDVLGKCLEIGCGDQYTVHEAVVALHEAAVVRPDLSDKIFEKFDGVKNWVEGKAKHEMVAGIDEGYMQSYYWLTNIAESQPKLAKPALEKFKEFVQLPGNYERSLKCAADKLEDFSHFYPDLLSEIQDTYKEILKSNKLDDKTRQDVEKAMNYSEKRMQKSIEKRAIQETKTFEKTDLTR